MPPMKLCVAAGIETPRLTFSAASAGRLANAAAATAVSARRRVKVVMLGVSLWLMERTGKGLAATSLEERDDDDHEALHRSVQVHADDAGEIEDVADDREQDRADHRAGDAARAALERGAADDHRGDRFQLPQQARRGRGGP